MGKQLELTRLSLSSPHIDKEARVLVLSDLHERVEAAWTEQICAVEADFAVIAGDCLEYHGCDDAKRRATLSLVRALSEKMPVFCSLGNHELGTRGNRAPKGEHDGGRLLPPTTLELCRLLSDAGATVLHNRAVRHGSFCIGGLTSAGGAALCTRLLTDMARENGFRLLLCHHPEYYDRYVAPHSIDLTVAGHAHGGQWRLLGHGLYAPGQGLFPRYTSGFYEQDRLLVSRGLGGRFRVPRIGNPRHFLCLTIRPSNEK